MSLGINTTTPEGIVLAADSRQSYRNSKGMSRIGSDSASKVFKLGDRCGLIVAGLAFLPENGVRKNISRFIEEFRQLSNINDLTVEQVAGELKSFFEVKYSYKDQLKALPGQIEADLKRQGCKILSVQEEGNHIVFVFNDKDGVRKTGFAGVDQLQFILAGYDKAGNHQVCMIYVPGEVDIKRDGLKKGKEYGASWIGQTDVVGRIVLGFDVRMSNLPIIQKAIEDTSSSEVQGQLQALEYVIQWGTMTLQDGIDFSTLAIETTTAIQRFSDGIKADPGDMPGVGGPVDIAVITPQKGFVWISKKNLKYGDQEVSLEDLPDLTNQKESDRLPSKAKKTKRK